MTEKVSMKVKRVGIVLVTSLLLAACDGREPAERTVSKELTAQTEKEEKEILSEELQGEEAGEKETEEAEEQEDITENKYVLAGSIYTDCMLGTEIWSQYEYDDNGKLIAKRIYDAASVENCEEYLYDSNGNVIQENIVYSDGTAMSGNSYEYDEEGYLKKHILKFIDGSENIISYEYETDSRGVRTGCIVYNSAGEQVSSYVYEYDTDGVLKKEYKYSADGEIEQEITYDVNQNAVSDYYYISGEPQIKTLYEYDEYGNRKKIINVNGTQERADTFINSYDEQNHLIHVERYDGKNELIESTDYVYTILDENYHLYSLDETYLQIAANESIQESEETNDERIEEANNKLIADNFDYEQLERLILNDMTVFTSGEHGEYGKHHMALESIELRETGVDELDGRKYAEVTLIYSSIYGTFRYIGRAYYETNLNGVQEITECRKVGFFPDNPDVNWEEIDQVLTEQAHSYVFAGSYYNVDVDKYGNEVTNMNMKRTFAAENQFTGIYHETTPVNDEYGFYVFSQSDVEEYQFMLQICWRNGLCDKYYGNELDEQYRIELYPYSIYDGILSEPLILKYM